MNFPPVLFSNQDFSNQISNNYSSRNSSYLFQYQILCKKLLKFENKDQNFQSNVINWIKSLEIQQLIKYFSFKNKWFTDILHEMILISDSKQDLKYKFIEASNCETEQKEPQNTKSNTYMNFLISQKENPRFFDYFYICDDGLISLSRNKSPEEKLKKKFIDNIRYITLTSSDSTSTYNGNNTNNNNNNSSTNDKKEEIIYTEYNNVITLSHDYLLNMDQLLQTFNEISNKSCFKYPIEVESKISKSGKKMFYNFKLPKWLGDKFTLPELLCAYFEQSILVNYQYYLSYNNEISNLYYSQMDELLENIYKLKEFIFSNKDSVNIMENIKCEEIKKIYCDNQYIKKVINDKKSIDDDIRNNYIGKISYSKKHTIKTIITNTLAYLGKLFINDKLNFILSITFIKDSTIFTTEDFAYKIVFDLINDYWKNKMAEDLLKDLDYNNDKDNENKKRKKKKKKKKDGKNESKINDNDDNNKDINNNEEINDKENNIDEKEIENESNNKNKSNDEGKEICEINDEINDNNKKDLIEGKEDTKIKNKEKESEKRYNGNILNENNVNKSINEEVLDNKQEIINKDQVEVNKIKEEKKETNNESNIEEENANFNNKKKKEKSFFLYPTVKDKKKKNKPKKKDKDKNINSFPKTELPYKQQNINENPKDNEVLLEKTESDDKIEIISELNLCIKNDKKEKEKSKKNKNGFEQINSKQKNKFNMGMKLKNMLKENENLIIPKNYLAHDSSFNKLNHKNNIKNDEYLENSDGNNSSTTEGSSLQSNINYIAGTKFPKFTSFNFQSNKKGKKYRNKQNNNININIVSNSYNFISNNILEFSKEIIDNTIKVNNNKRILEKAREKYIKKIYELINIFLNNEKIDFLCSFYGSTISGLSIENSDIDIMVKLKKNENDNDYLRNVMNILANNLKNNNINYISNIIPIFSASVPVIKLECNLNNDESFSSEVNTLMKKCNLSFNDITKLYFDITFFVVENENNRIPSELMIDYIKETIMTYPQIIDIMYVMKRFLFNKKLNKSYQGGISSYSLFLLTLAFVKYYKNIHNLPVGTLLTEFLNHYINFDFYNNVIQPNLDDNIYSSFENYHDFNKYSLNIIDPITGLNVSKSTFKIEQIQNAFREGLDIILGNFGKINNGIFNNNNNAKILDSFLGK